MAYNKLHLMLLNILDQRPAIAKYHWSLNSVRGGKIAGSPGKSMSVIGGIKVHGGVATLNDGIDRGYIDAGDFQGECISGLFTNSSQILFCTLLYLIVGVILHFWKFFTPYSVLQ